MPGLKDDAASFKTPDAKSQALVEVHISPWKLAIFLFALIFLIAAVSLMLQYSLLHWDYNVGANIVRIFNVDVENNLPTWFSSLMLTACSAVAAVIAMAYLRRGERYFYHFAGIVVIFLYLSLDETSSFHEVPSRLVREGLGTSGAFHPAWVIPAAIAVLIVAAAYLRFFLHLPTKFKALFFLSAALFVGGAIGFEILGWNYFHSRYVQLGDEGRDFTYALWNHAEEVCEMLGTALFLTSLLLFAQEKRISASLQAGARPALPSA
jgi:hypothetical protein